MGLMQYCQDCDERYRTRYGANPSPYPLIYEALEPYLKNHQIWLCPAKGGLMRGGSPQPHTPATTGGSSPFRRTTAESAPGRDRWSR